jgi:hydroxymethylpyrimidine/phosphomethylpyrimidine kinase
MNSLTENRPVVLCFSGHDPSGGAGIQADIETLASHQCHTCSIITTLTEQDTRNVYKIIPQAATDILAQTETLLNDITINAIKIGLLGHHETAIAIKEILQKLPQIPVILDPVLAAGGGTQLSNKPLLDAMLDLMPLTSVLTPNCQEARKLATDGVSIEQCGTHLLEKGCDYVLITGADENTTHVVNQLFHQNQCIETFTWERLPASYHGSGCTLAASIAALTAHGLEPFSAIQEAQEYTWNSLKAAYQPGHGQYNPNRLFWMRED